MSQMRNPSEDKTPLDLASFYVEDLKYGPGPSRLERVGEERFIAQLEVLLRDTAVNSMTGEELLDASDYYVANMAATFHMPLVLARSVWFDGLMHGMALAGRLTGELRDHD